MASKKKKWNRVTKGVSTKREITCPGVESKGISTLASWAETEERSQANEQTMGYLFNLKIAIITFTTYFCFKLLEI